MDFGSPRFGQDNQLHSLQGRLPAFSASSSSSSKNPISRDAQFLQYLPQTTVEVMESDEDFDGVANGGLFVEKEHMFDKVVTPSDVGKLNRLVIPKQHAEKYFPLDSSTHEKGLLLNFEDRNGKSWRFRYSYWTSSQSYVMTKGWSRFVKEKRLDAGDVVSFQREVGKDRFYIDWRRRPDATETSIPHHFHLHQWSSSSLRRAVAPLSVARDHVNLLQNNNVSHGIVSVSGGLYGYGGVMNPWHGHGGSVFYLGSAAPGQVGPAPLQSVGSSEAEPIVIDSVPVAREKAAAKRFRLFGVNMECPVSESDECDSTTMSHSDSTMALETPLQFGQYNHNGRPMPNQPTDFFRKGKSSLSLDFGT